jgi:hypothetical protein
LERELAGDRQSALFRFFPECLQRGRPILFGGGGELICANNAHEALGRPKKVLKLFRREIEATGRSVRSLRFGGASKALVRRSVPCDSIRAGDQTGSHRRHDRRSARGDRKRVGHLHSVNHQFLPIRWFRPAPQGIRDLFALQRSVERLDSSTRKHDRKAPPQDGSR